jgi:hypothetical protein
MKTAFLYDRLAPVRTGAKERVLIAAPRDQKNCDARGSRLITNGPSQRTCQQKRLVEAAVL